MLTCNNEACTDAQEARGTGIVWPGVTDFSEALQNPRLCFHGTDLEPGDVSLNPRGMPLVFSGAFASVYPVSVEGHTYAVRCFTREVKDQQAR